MEQTVQVENPEIRLPLFLLLPLISLASVAAVLYTPALPMLANDYHLPYQTMQLTITIFLVTYTLGQWLYGPLANFWGRKPTLYAGIVLGIIGSLLCVFAGYSHSFKWLVAGRAVQGLGTSVGLVLALVMINDVYHGVKLRKVISYTMLAFALSPTLAIFAGGALVHYFNWESCFYFLAIYLFIFLLATFRLPETSQRLNKQALHWHNSVLVYIRLFKNASLIAHSCLWGCCTAIFYIVAAMLPRICIGVLQISPGLFGVINLILAVAMVAGILISARLVDFFSARHLILIGAGILFLSVVCYLALNWWHVLSIINLYICLSFAYFSMPLIFSNAAAIATSSLKDKSTGSSFASLLNMTFAVLALAATQVVPITTVLLMPLTLLVLSGLILLLYVVTGRLAPENL